MREIKFRAWNKNTKTMGDPVSLLAILNWRGNAAATPIDTDPMFYMQYTGLKDKNGKEIYEGDVLRNTWSSSEQIGRVVILPTGVRLEHSDGLTGEVFTSQLWLDKEIEIIGNIYEHPELLTS